MIWQQVYAPIANSLGWSALAAALPVFVLLFVLGVWRVPAWKASVAGLAAALATALFVYHMPAGLAASATLYGAAFGLFPIGWIVYWAIVLYNLTVETGQFEIIKSSVGHLTGDQRLQALLIAFAFGAFLEGATGFGTPVAIAASMLAGLGFPPFRAAAICLLANTAPVAFGAIGIPLVTLAGITGLPLGSLSANVGRVCAPLSLFIPAYLVLVLGGWRGLAGVIPAAITCGVAFAGTQFLVSNFVGPYLTDILSSLIAMAALVMLCRVWKPKGALPGCATETTRKVLRAWMPYLLLVIFVGLWGIAPVKHLLGLATLHIAWPGLHNQILRMAPVVQKASPYPAMFTFDFFAASGSACMFATIAAAAYLRVSPMRFSRLLAATARQLFFPMVTIAAVLALAFLMNYSGSTATMGLAFAATAKLFPFFSALLGWLGVFLTGSDTASNALFGNLQVVTANRLGLNPVLMAAANSSGGVMGKMVSLQSIAVAAAATGMPASDEPKLFRFTLRHSLFLAFIIALIVSVYAYCLPGWAR